jgi:DNA-binding transcriptional MerR regulator
VELLRKKDVIEKVAVAKSTVSDWITEYHMYIPTVQQGVRTYYKPSVIDVLMTVKELREKDVSKAAIAEELAKLYPINVDDVVSDVEKVKQGESDKSDAMIVVMSTVGKALDQLGRQDERIREQDRKLAEMEQKQKEYEQIIEEVRKEAAAGQEKFEELQLQIRAMKEEEPKGFWKSLFGKNN